MHNTNKEIKSVVFETKNYNQFKKVRGNRDVDQSHVERLKRNIADRKLDIPIIVNKRDMSLMDGQHRLEAYRQLGLPIKFILGDFEDHLDVARINANQKRWSLNNYASFHNKRGKQDYGIAIHVSEKYEVTIEAAILMLLQKSAMYKNIASDFMLGNFKIPSGNLRKAHDLGERMLIAKQYIPNYKRAFISAFIMTNKHPDFNWDRFKSSLKVNGMKLMSATNRESYLQWFEHIYNSGLKGDKYKKIKLIQWVKDRGYNETDQLDQ